ncbi:nuclear transport factor 2 family protein [Streptomyces sp. NPDC101062]|uniref:YybH family protein n=1 Tax=unclassified Streptomyces TaxID=2593676 RepID=UPI002E796EB8|nr:nuclear transport factor 2 family protein [Streptomyces sp. JV176]MEE1797996.1 nuclear transport factor 2 family protein [Streptomyces sp. JV176]
MSNSTDEQITLPTEPDQLSTAFELAFNSGRLEAIQQLFAPNAMRVLAPGQYQTGEEMWKSAEATLPDRLPVTLSVRHIYTVDDTALLICDYVHEGTGPDGTHQRVEGTAADILRRGADGVWRCLISNPPGTTRA